MIRRRATMLACLGVVHKDARPSIVYAFNRARAGHRRGTFSGNPRFAPMKRFRSNDAVKIRMMAAQLRHHAAATSLPAYIVKFERAASELESRAEEAERDLGRNRPRRLDS
jgi:hypothetical protein